MCCVCMNVWTFGVLKRLCKCQALTYKSLSRIAFHLANTTMHLYPSSSTLSNTTFRNKDGQIIYKIESSTRCLSRQTTIKRIVPSNNIDLGKGSDNALQPSFTDLAEFHYEFLSSRIGYNGTEIATSDFFRKSGLLGR